MIYTDKEKVANNILSKIIVKKQRLFSVLHYQSISKKPLKTEHKMLWLWFNYHKGAEPVLGGGLFLTMKSPGVLVLTWLTWACSMKGTFQPKTWHLYHLLHLGLSKLNLKICETPDILVIRLGHHTFRFWKSHSKWARHSGNTAICFRDDFYISGTYMNLSWMVLLYLCNQKYGTIVLEYNILPGINWDFCVYRNTKDTSGTSNRNAKSGLSISAKNMKLQMKFSFRTVEQITGLYGNKLTQVWNIARHLSMSSIGWAVNSSKRTRSKCLIKAQKLWFA